MDRNQCEETKINILIADRSGTNGILVSLFWLGSFLFCFNLFSHWVWVSEWVCVCESNSFLISCERHQINCDQISPYPIARWFKMASTFCQRWFHSYTKCALKSFVRILWTNRHHRRNCVVHTSKREKRTQCANARRKEKRNEWNCN